MEYQLYELEPYDGMPSAWMVLDEYDKFHCVEKLNKDEIDRLLDNSKYSNNVLRLLLDVDDFGNSEQATYLGMFDNIEELIQEINMRSLLEA